MVKAGAAQNQTVEEILASIRQAISEDEAKRRAARVEGEPETVDVSEIKDIGSQADHEREEGEGKRQRAAVAARDPAMQEVIDLAIEKALDGVRAELEIDDDPEEDGPGETPEPTPVVARPRRGLATSPAPGQPVNKPPLLSPRAGAAVSASFDDLARSMAPDRADKMEKVVEGILRPMLRSWMEENLPTLVERLVREEIDRVSRGRR